jgi:hypothetical protein
MIATVPPVPVELMVPVFVADRRSTGQRGKDESIKNAA